MLAAVALGTILVLLAVTGRDQLVELRERAFASWAEVRSNLESRHELVSAVLAALERIGFSTVSANSVYDANRSAVAALEWAAPDTDVDALSSVEADLTRAISDLIVAIEQHPELKRDPHVRALLDAIATSQDRIAGSQHRYDDAATLHNERLRRLPWKATATWARAQPLRAWTRR